jgi:hypothetical protein
VFKIRNPASCRIFFNLKLRDLDLCRFEEFIGKYGNFGLGLYQRAPWQ